MSRVGKECAHSLGAEARAHEFDGLIMREGVKQAVLRLAVDVGVASLSRRWHARSGVILAYHNIVPDGTVPDGERPLHLPQSQFSRQLDRLAETHEIVGLDRLLAADRRDRPVAAITFDDAYRGALTAGLEELRARDLPATYFVCPGLLGGVTFWWDAIASENSGLLSDEVRLRALSDLEGRRSRILRWAEREGIPLGTVRRSCRSGSFTELRDAADHSGVTIGSHTWSHPNLQSIGAEEGRREVKRARTWLMRKLPSVIPWLAYPYGLAPSQPLGLKHDGDDFAVTIEPRLVDLENPRANSSPIPRVNISASLSLSRFELLVSGL